MKTFQFKSSELKKLSIFSLFLLLPFLLSADQNSNRLDGIWINPVDHKTIKIVTNRNYIKAKYLSDHDWERFYRVGRLIFKDKWGNYIKLVNDYTFKYYNTQTSSHKVFRKNGYNTYPPTNIRVTSIEGEWFASSLGKKVIIEKTSLGLRSKILGDEFDWEYYRKGRGKYIDRNGNSMDLKDANSLVWFSSDGHTILRLTR